MNKISQTEEIQQTLQQIYLKNLTFLKNYEPKIYNKINIFETKNEEHYSLEFNNIFQLINLENKNNLYNNDPFIDSLERVSNFEFSKAFTLINLDKINKSIPYKDEINSITYLNQYLNNFNNINISFNKFIFIGTLLGVHINDFHKNFNCKAYLIIEPNIEIFRLSLFLCDYETLTKDSKIFFSIEENNYEFEEKVKEFLAYKYELNHLIHFELASNDYSYLINQLQDIFISNSEMRYPFSEFLISLKRGYKYFFEEKKSIINLSIKQNFFQNKKVLFLGAGVSLEKNIDWLLLNKDKFIVVASSAVLKHLKLLEIIPDIIISIDGQRTQMLEQFNVDDYMYKNSIILASIKLDTELFLKLKDTNIFFIQNSLELFPKYGFLSGITVGDLGIDILAKLGAKEIYILGIDASIDSKTGQTHISTHRSSKKISLNTKDSGNIRADIMFVKGNLGKKVPTFKEYLEMIESVEDIISKHKEYLQVYNLGSGAYFNNSIPLKINDLKINCDDIINKKEFKLIFLDNLGKIVKTELNKIDIEDLKNEKKLLEYLNNIDKKQFHKEFMIIFDKNPNSTICNIFDKFFKLTLPYCNILKEENIKNNILYSQINELLNSFNSSFDRIRKTYAEKV